MNTINGQLDAIYCRVATDRRIVFGYRKQRRQIFESIRPWDIREALQIGLKTIEEAFPGALAKASALDDDDWLSSRSRTRRYIAESPDVSGGEKVCH